MVLHATNPEASWLSVYLVACLACKLGRLEFVADALKVAIESADDPKELKLKALDEPDLQRLWRPGE